MRMSAAGPSKNAELQAALGAANEVSVGVQ